MATRTTPHPHTMERAIENRINCHRICLETAARHFAGEPSPRMEEQLVRLLLDCSEICRTSADFMIRGSAVHQHTCRACAEICRRCAEPCREMAGVTA